MSLKQRILTNRAQGSAEGDTTALRVLLLGIFVSAAGASLASIGFSLLAAQSGQSSLLAAVLAANLVPTVLFGLVGGHISDRYMAWWWWPASLVLAAVITLLMAITLDWVVIIAGCALISSCAALVGPVAHKLIAHYSANSARTGSQLAVVQGAAGVLGVAAGGMSFGAGALRTMLVIDAIAMLLLALIGVMLARQGALARDERPHKIQLTQGLRLLSSPRAFGSLGLLLIITTVTSTSLDDVSGIFALTRDLGLSPTQYGFASASWAVGIVAGSWLGSRITEKPLVYYPLVALPIGLAIGAVGLLQPGFTTIMVLFAAGGVGNGAFNALTNRVILSSVPEHQQGRAWAGFRWIVYVCLLSGYAVGAALGSQYALHLMAYGGSALVLCALANVLGRVVLARGGCE